MTLEMEGRVKEAAQVLTLSIEEGRTDELDTRKRAVDKIIQIFTKQEMLDKVPDLMIQQEKMGQHKKEIIFMMESSQGEQAQD